jgi:PAS domain S-box-containing protein
MQAALPADTPGMKRRVWFLYLVAGVTMLFSFVFVHSIRVGPLFNAIALSSPIAILIAAKWHRPAQWLPWILVAVGQVLFVGGDILTYNYTRFFGTELPFPSFGDAFYLGVYPFLVGGLLLMVRRRTPGGDRASLIDSLILSVGVGTLSWVFLIAPYVRDPSLTLVQKLVAIGYPLVDLALFTMAVRLAVGTGKRPPAFHLMISSVAVLFVTDSIYGWIVLHGGYDNTTGSLEIGWGLFYLLFGAAALHSSMRTLDNPSPERELKQPRRRIVLLASASLIAPGVLLFQAVSGHAVDVGVLASCAAALFILVLIRLNGLMVDVTEYRRAERALRDAENKYRSLVEGLPAVVYIAEFGAEGSWRYISPQIESIFGFSRDEWMGAEQLWRESILPDDRDQALRAEEGLLSGERRMQCEYRIHGRDGRTIWIREEAEALEDELGTAQLLQGVMYDITEQKQAEEQLVTALETEKEASNQLRAAQEMQNSFLQAVSHDLRTPLTSIMGSALTLEQNEQLDPEDAKDLVRRMATNARKLHRLLTNLLDLDRMSRGIVQPNRNITDLNRLILGVLEEIQAETHPIELTTRQPVYANVDAAQVERIVENLITNAIRYTPDGTPIWASIEEQNDGVVLTIEDAGPGVSEELKQRIFEPFRQGKEIINTHSPGVGIGLSLVARFAELHSGRAWVKDRPGGGASFSVFLPHEGELPGAESAGEPEETADAQVAPSSAASG